jgi:thiol-disulfide isomerase/thioredoxin
MRLLFPSLLTLVFALWSVPLAAQDKPKTAERYKVFDTYDELDAHLGKYAGQTLVVNFWATYCLPCIKEVPYFNELQEKYQSQNLKVVMVNLDFKGQLKARLDKFLDERSLNLEIVVLADQDADVWIPRVMSDWDGGLPFTMILQKGSIKDTHRTEFEHFDDLDKFVKPFLGPKPVVVAKRRR